MTNEKSERSMLADLVRETWQLLPHPDQERPVPIWDINLDGAQFDSPIFLIPLRGNRGEEER